jgi:AP-3 complex subunit delta-1
MFENTQTDLIRGLRTHKYSLDYIEKSLLQIQVEITKPKLRANAIQKLLVFHLLGRNIQWAAFHIIQAMSITEEKKLGYMAAAIAFNQNSPILIMATNVIKKDLSSNNVKDVLMAMHTLAQICSSDLARDLYGDVVTMLNHSNTNVRKRAILVLYRMFVNYPACIPICFPRLQTKLDDDDPAVVSCCVTVICELGRSNPKQYLNLAPQLFSLFVSSANNWMLIKMVKLFATLTPHEPRLIRKLLPPLKKIIIANSSVSVVFECVKAIIVGDMLAGNDKETQEVSKICIKKLELFLESKDQNIRYLGLSTLSGLAKISPSIVSDNHQIILQCLDDGDISIKTQALNLVTGLVLQVNTG